MLGQRKDNGDHSRAGAGCEVQQSQEPEFEFKYSLLTFCCALDPNQRGLSRVPIPPSSTQVGNSSWKS